MNIHILAVPNIQIAARKGFTGADWWFDIYGDLQVRVATELEDWREQVSLAMHEATEAILCKYDGVTVQDVDRFDITYGKENRVDLNAGDDPKSPYRRQHTFATAVERILTGYMNVDWLPYDERLSAL